MIFIVDDDEIMAECIARATGRETRIFQNGYEFMGAISEAPSSSELPELIFLDILLDGPDGFTLLNELMSYPDTARIPIVIVSSLDFSGRDLSIYNVKKVLSKEKMRPEEIKEICDEFTAGT